MALRLSPLSIAIGLSFVVSPLYAAQSNDVTQLETMVVTAQKVEQDEQLIPISMSTFSDYDLERSGTENTYELINRSPNVSMIKAGNPSDGSFISMRGITPTMEGSQTVLFLIDNVPYQTFDTDLLDVERVEVLRGPQGTLYGRNASSGVISVITKDPEFYSEGSAGITYGNYNHIKGTLISGGAISNSDSWAYRTALQYTLNDGYFTRDQDGKDDINDVDDFNGRMKLRWAPTDNNWDVVATLQGQRARNGSTSFAPLEKIKQDSHRVYSDYDGGATVDIYTGSVRATYEGERVNFESISAYTSEKKTDYTDVDFSVTPAWVLQIDGKQERLTQELRWSSKQDGDLRWLAGLYFYDESAKSHVKFDMKNFGMVNDLDSKTDTVNYAVFGNIAYSLSDKWELIAGLRLDHERVNFDYADKYNVGMPDTIDSNSSSYTEWLPKVGVNYYAQQDLMFYGTIARGYKSGGFNMLTPAGLPAKFDPEYTMNYEMGMKSEWLDNRVRFNTALFWIDWKDQQVEQQLYPKSFTENAGKTVSRGIEAELSWFAMPGVRLFTNGGFNDAHFTDYVGKIYDPSGNEVGQKDYKNNRPANAPRYNYSVGVDYNFLEHYFVYADYNVLGDMYFDIENTVEQSSYGIFNLRTGYSDDRFDVTLWAKNLFDQEYVTRAFSMKDLNQQDTWFARSGDPMTFGITANVKW
ncbi:TonB-dependent receptor [Photobacterium frigidiphilum]|uniref:TonB-dependent receptor n=1 Tax=Photobacterium frigidiphilum TaxID=264736 RepID=UPI003D0D6090